MLHTVVVLVAVYVMHLLVMYHMMGKKKTSILCHYLLKREDALNSCFDFHT
jgi:hypothetical protein